MQKVFCRVQWQSNKAKFDFAAAKRFFGKDKK